MFVCASEKEISSCEFLFPSSLPSSPHSSFSSHPDTGGSDVRNTRDTQTVAAAEADNHDEEEEALLESDESEGVEKEEGGSAEEINEETCSTTREQGPMTTFSSKYAKGGEGGREILVVICIYT